MLAHICDPSTPGVEARGPEVQGLLGCICIQGVLGLMTRGVRE